MSRQLFLSFLPIHGLDIHYELSQMPVRQKRKENAMNACSRQLLILATAVMFLLIPQSGIAEEWNLEEKPWEKFGVNLYLGSLYLGSGQVNMLYFYVFNPNHRRFQALFRSF